MKFLSWFPRILATLIGVLGMIVVVSFALSNRQRVQLDLWPFDLQIEPHLILLLGVTFLFGFLTGAAAMWVSGSRKRRQAREVKRTASRLEQQVAQLENRRPQVANQDGAGQGGVGQGGGLPMTAGGNRP